MEAHRQQCQNCQSIDTRNLLVRQVDEQTVVFVRCAKCGELVARYKLIEYYHHGKDVESFLRSRGAVAVESGRRMLQEFERVKSESIEGYEEALEYLREHDKNV